MPGSFDDQHLCGHDSRTTRVRPDHQRIDQEQWRSDRARRRRRHALTWLRKLGLAALVLWAAASVTFILQALTPGDRATLLLNTASGESRERTAAEIGPVNEQYGFTDPVWQQYRDYLRGLLRGDLGTSYQLQEPVFDLILRQIGPTLVLTLGALVVAWIIVAVVTSITTGRPGPLGALGSFGETVSAALPHYFLGSILLVIFAINLGWFPVESGSSPAGLVLPVLTLAIPLAGFLGQVTRDEFGRALDQPFVLSARARGAGEYRIRLRHVLRHALIPAVTISGWAMGALFSGAVIAETVFARAGIGQTLVQAANSRDVPLVSGIVVFVAAVYVIANLIVDFLYTIIDPRIELS